MRKARQKEEGAAPEVLVSGGESSVALQQKWAYSSELTFVSASVTATGYVVASDDACTLCCISPDGELLFSKHFDEKISAFRLSRDGGTLLVALPDRGLALLDSMGQVLWLKKHIRLISALDIRVSDQVILAGGAARTLIALDRDGECVNSVALPEPVEFIEVSRDEKLILVGNGNAFLAMINDQLDVLWMKRLATMCGRAQFSPCGKWIVLPAFGMGAYLFDHEGRDAQAFRTARPVSFAACLCEGRSVALGTVDGQLLLVRRDGTTESRYELPCRPRSWTVDTSSHFTVIVDVVGSVHCYELISGEGSRFSFLEHSGAKDEPGEKRPIYCVTLYSRASSHCSAQVRVLPGGKHAICATSEGQVFSYDDKGKPREIASLGSTVFSLRLASRSYRFAATTEGCLHAFAHDKLLWQRRIGTAMLAINALGNHFATMDNGGNIFVFDSDGELIRTWKESPNARYFLLSPSGENMVVAEARRAVLVDFKGRGVFAVDFSPGGSRLAVDEQLLYVGDTRGGVSAFDLVGKRQWSVSVKEPVSRLRPFEDGLFCTTTTMRAFLIRDDGTIAWEKKLASNNSTVARNQERRFIEVFRHQKALICIALGGELLWRASLKGLNPSLTVDASGEFIGAFDGAHAWLFSVSDYQPDEPDRFDYLEI